MGIKGNILVFDVGTSALKAVVFRPDGKIAASKEVVFPPTIDPHHRAPDDWWQAAIAASRAIKPENIAAISLAGTMENLIHVDKEGNALGDALLYSNPCGTNAFAAFEQGDLDVAQFVSITGNAPEPLMSVFKLGWLHQNQPEIYANARWFLPGSKDYLTLKMTGNAVTDATCAATTGLLDLISRNWSKRLLSHFNVAPKKLPKVLAASEIVGPLNEGAATELGLPPGTPVINGCGDGGATTIGGGAIRENQVSLYLGTSGWIARIAARPDELQPCPFFSLPHPLSDAIIEIAPILSAGAATNWARKTLNISLEQAEKLALEADIHPAEVVFLPYLNGERFPFLDLDLRAGFFKMSANDGPGTLYYAVLEGIAFSFLANLEAMGPSNKKLDQVSLVGGGAQSKIWPKIIADVLNCPILLPDAALFATSFGAFKIALAALAGGDVDMGSATTIIRPRHQRRARIQRQFSRFKTATDFARTLD